jgi:hypothetical protein
MTDDGDDFTPEDEAEFAEATQAWENIKETRDWAGWRKILLAVDKARKKFADDLGLNDPHSDSKELKNKMGEWLKKHRLNEIHKSDRSRLQRIAENLEAVERWRESLSDSDRVKKNGPTAVWGGYQASLGDGVEKPKKKTPKDEQIEGLYKVIEERDQQICDLQNRVLELKQAAADAKFEAAATPKDIAPSKSLSNGEDREHGAQVLPFAPPRPLPSPPAPILAAPISTDRVVVYKLSDKDWRTVRTNGAEEPSEATARLATFCTTATEAIKDAQNAASRWSLPFDPVMRPLTPHTNGATPPATVETPAPKSKGGRPSKFPTEGGPDDVLKVFDHPSERGIWVVVRVARGAPAPHAVLVASKITARTQEKAEAAARYYARRHDLEYVPHEKP